MRKTETISTVTCDLCGYKIGDSIIEAYSTYECEINGIKVDLCTKCETNMHFDLPFLSHLLGIELTFKSINHRRQMELDKMEYLR